jgi:hypothetical protein
VGKALEGNALDENVEPVFAIPRPLLPVEVLLPPNRPLDCANASRAAPANAQQPMTAIRDRDRILKCMVLPPVTGLERVLK